MSTEVMYIFIDPDYCSRLNRRKLGQRRIQLQSLSDPCNRRSERREPKHREKQRVKKLAESEERAANNMTEKEKARKGQFLAQLSAGPLTGAAPNTSNLPRSEFFVPGKQYKMVTGSATAVRSGPTTIVSAAPRQSRETPEPSQRPEKPQTRRSPKPDPGIIPATLGQTSSKRSSIRKGNMEKAAEISANLELRRAQKEQETKYSKVVDGQRRAQKAEEKTELAITEKVGHAGPTVQPKLEKGDDSESELDSNGKRNATKGGDSRVKLKATQGVNKFLQIAKKGGFIGTGAAGLAEGTSIDVPVDMSKAGITGRDDADIDWDVKLEASPTETKEQLRQISLLVDDLSDLMGTIVAQEGTPTSETSLTGVSPESPIGISETQSPLAVTKPLLESLASSTGPTESDVDYMETYDDRNAASSDEGGPRGEDMGQ